VDVVPSIGVIVGLNVGGGSGVSDRGSIAVLGSVDVMIIDSAVDVLSVCTATLQLVMNK